MIPTPERRRCICPVPAARRARFGVAFAAPPRQERQRRRPHRGGARLLRLRGKSTLTGGSCLLRLAEAVGEPGVMVLANCRSFWVSSREDLLHPGGGTRTLLTVAMSRLGVAGRAVTRGFAATRGGRRRTTRRSACRRESGCVRRGCRALTRTSGRALGASGRPPRSRAFARVCARS